MENKIKAENNYQNLSSTTLFNFTDTFEHLVSNLKNGFYCGEIYEKLPLKNIISGYRVPMVCFCDIPLGQIKEHLGWYGNFAIGIRRDYARMHGINPVWYLHSDNLILKRLYNSKEHIELKESPILPYIKQFLGYQKISDGTRKKKKFYDEREWRYIPQDNIYRAELILKGKHIENEALVESNKKETFMPLKLETIEYIIVNNEENKTRLYEVLRDLSDNNSRVSYEKLISSILTCNQIRKDF